MHVWTIQPGEQPVLKDIGQMDPVSFAREFIGDTIDFTRVVFQDRMRHMAVDDLGHPKGLPINRCATFYYHAACIPGTTHVMRGPAVIFAGLLQ